MIWEVWSISIIICWNPLSSYIDRLYSITCSYLHHYQCFIILLYSRISPPVRMGSISIKSLLGVWQGWGLWLGLDLVQVQIWTSWRVKEDCPEQACIQTMASWVLGTCTPPTTPGCWEQAWDILVKTTPNCWEWEEGWEDRISTTPSCRTATWPASSTWTTIRPPCQTYHRHISQNLDQDNYYVVLSAIFANTLFIIISERFLEKFQLFFLI